MRDGIAAVDAAGGTAAAMSTRSGVTAGPAGRATAVTFNGTATGARLVDAAEATLGGGSFAATIVDAGVDVSTTATPPTTMPAAIASKAVDGRHAPAPEPPVG